VVINVPWYLEEPRIEEALAPKEKGPEKQRQGR
jgi:hypothetical protein